MIGDTIAAIATPKGQGGVGVIRISGSLSLPILQQVFRPAGEKNQGAAQNHRYQPHPRELTLGWIENQGGVILDQALTVYMPAPHSYTREDVAEIQCHGGSRVLEEILQLVLSCGARLALPGEFTQRAFLNGGLDLTQAEAIIDLIEAKTAKEGKIAAQQLAGGLKDQIEAVSDNLLDVIASIEGDIDYPDEGVDTLNRAQMTIDIEKAIGKLDELLRLREQGKIYKEGVRAVIIGRPNVGKSSLMNLLLQEERAIVTDIAGTTRDTIEEEINLNGFRLILTDTAGIREENQADAVEKIGIAKSKKALAEAELLIFMIDGTAGITAEDEEILHRCKNATGKMLLLSNKWDLISPEAKERLEQEIRDKAPAIPFVTISVLTGTGCEKIGAVIQEIFTQNQMGVADEAAIISARHQEIILRAKDYLTESLTAVASGLPGDFIAVDLTAAWKKLGEITGKTAAQDIIDRVFSRFCLGK